MNLVLLVAGFFTVGASLISFWLIMRHQQNMSNPSVQSKIVGIIWMIPIYAIDSFLGLWMPNNAEYVNMLRDCYEAYVLYLFLSLMLSYLGCEDEECEYRLVTYLEKLPTVKRSCPFNWICGDEEPKGREFLRYCKFGTLQYCVVRPLTTAIAMILDQFDLYHESDMSFSYGYIYILFIMNVSIGYAFIVLASFYHSMKYKLKPYEPVGKFLCIKCVIFFAFWQSVVITCLVKVGVITEIGIYDAQKVSTGMQNFLICIEMFLAAIAFTYTFGFEPFTAGYVNEKEQQMLRNEYDAENQAALEHFTSNPVHNFGNKGGKHSKHYKKHVGLLNAIRSNNSGHKKAHASSSNGATGFSVDSDSVNAANKYQLIEMTHDDVVRTTPLVSNSSGGTPSAAVYTNNKAGSHVIGGSSRPNGYSSSHMPHHVKEPHTMVGRAGDLLDKHFAARTAIRDFNQTMPLVLPTGFEMHRGIQVNSDPEARLRALEEENRLLNED